MSDYDNDSQAFFFCPGCFAELEVTYSQKWSEKAPTVSKCPVCGDKLLEVPDAGAMWNVRYHMREVHRALHPVAEKEEEQEGGEE